MDDAGKRAYLTGFFSGDGNISVCRQEGRTSYMIRIYSSDREGLEGIREAFEDLGFHPNEIHERVEERENKVEISYGFSIPAKEHLQFIWEMVDRLKL